MLAPAPMACAVYGASELLLMLRKRAGSTAERYDRGSLAVFWIVISLGVAASVVSAALFPQLGFRMRGARLIGVATLFVAGLALRWWAIVVLGRWFTVDVAIHAGHQLVTSGPYRWVRHPSYTGAAMAFLGTALMFEHWLALPLLLLPMSLAFFYRIRVEEQALVEAFGPRWVEYAGRTSRLIPGLY